MVVNQNRNNGATQKWTVIVITESDFLWIYDFDTPEDAVSYYNGVTNAGEFKRVMYLWPIGKIILDTDYPQLNQ